MTSKEYVKKLQDEAFKYDDAWEIKINDLDKDEENTLANMLDRKFQKHNKELVAGVLNPKDSNQPLVNFAKSLYNDIAYYTDNKYEELYKKTNLGFIKRGSIEAGCVSIDDFGKPFENGGYAILINIGLYYAINLLVKSIIVENLQNEWEKYKQNPLPILDSAKKIYLTHDTKVIENMKFNEFPQDIAQELSVVQANSTVRLMQFIALHEFGHIVNGDFGIMNLYHDTFVGKDINLTAKEHQKEFLADKFALESILNKDEKILSKWGSFYTISYFLIWIWGLEKILNQKISKVHPNPLDRVWYLYELMLKNHKDEYNYKALIENAIKKVEKWIKNYN